MDLESEFSRPVPIDQIAERGRIMEITASEAERLALARRVGLVRLDRLAAKVRLSRSGVFYRVEADWEADVVQTCVITLEPFASRLAEHLVERYGLADREATELDLDPEVDTPEAIEGGVIDVGETVAQALSLALDPYPRKPGATIEIPGEEGGGEGPFEALSKLRRGS
ncbi:MAG: DUF177 domain-containing protein [Alphaproteobacteria bacterium]|nr:DUF177 domain-containing protein [Alphaproteobacteria bacterium]